MNYFNILNDIVEDSLRALEKAGTLPPGLEHRGVTLEPPRDPKHGDVATNAALVLAGAAGMKPRAIAEPLAVLLRANADVASAEVAGPGFINLTMRTGFWHTRVAAAIAAGADYGRSVLGKRRGAVNVEYVSANPTGPMHVGHARGAVFGDALASLLVFSGHAVTREYYINDAGAQVDVLARSAYLRYREALGEAVGEIPEGLYPGEYLKPVGAALAQEFGTRWAALPEAEWLPTFRDRAIDAMMALIREDLGVMGVRHDVFVSERGLVADGKVEAVLAQLNSAALVYEGTLDPPKGKEPDDWEPREQTLFRATLFGDEVDRPLRKSDGSWTYFASDMAYHADKIRRGFKTLINVWGADHGGYVKRMEAAVKALSAETVSLDVKLCQLVKLMRRGEPVKMSKRAGTFVTLREVVDEVGKDVVRFIMLTRRNDAALDFDFAVVTEESRENPVFYVQYAHARCSSVLRTAGAEGGGRDLTPATLAKADLSRLTHPDELALMKTIAAWPRTVEAAALAHEPHRIAFYLRDLASSFHALWSRGKEEDGLRFIISGDEPLTLARMAMVKGCATALAVGLNIIGVAPVEELR